MHNVQIELDDILYNRYRELAKNDRRSVRSYITKMVIDNLSNHSEKKLAQSAPTPGGISYAQKTYFDKESEEWRIKDTTECVLCGGLLLPTMKYVGNPVAGFSHRECFDKENG